MAYETTDDDMIADGIDEARFQALHAGEEEEQEPEDEEEAYTPQHRLHLARLGKFREARVADAAYYWNSQYPGHQYARCLGLGFTEDEIFEGFELGYQVARERDANYSYFGNPMYGSTGVTPADQPIYTKVLIWMQGPSCVACHQSADTVAMRRLSEPNTVCCGGRL